jgi:ribonuclease D
MHEPQAAGNTATAVVRGAVGPPDALQRVLGSVAVDLGIVAKVARQTCLQEFIVRQELEREREGTEALQVLVHELSMELSVAGKVVATQSDIHNVLHRWGRKQNQPDTGESTTAQQ